MMEDLKASSREEALLAKIAGLDDPFANSIQPSSREEWFLSKIAEKTNSGGGAVYATFTEDGGTWTCDKTYDELKAAYDSGSIIFGVLAGTVGFPMIFASGGGRTGFGGCATYAEGSSSISDLYFYTLAVFSDGTVFGQERHKEFPT